MKNDAHPAFAGRIGVAREDITPPVGIYARNWGAAAHDTGEGIHRPFTLTALTLQPEAGGAPLVLIAADLGWWRRAVDEWFVRGAVLEALGLDSARVMVNLSHTHAGPSLCAEDRDRPGGEPIAPYLEKVRDAAVRAARRALTAAVPAVLDWTTGRCDLARNRDLPDPERPRRVCGYHPGAPADDTLLLGRVTDADGKILATIVNYACHPVTLAWDNRLLSPDYVGAMREVVEGHTGGAPCLFLQGASGELGPREQYVGDPAVADAHGRQLGFAALSALAGMLPPRIALTFAGVVESGAPLGTWSRAPREPDRTLAAACVEVELPLKPLPSLAELDRELAACGDRVTAERLTRKRHIRELVGEGETSRVPLWAWRAGDALLVGQMNEGYSPLQTELRQQYPEQAVVVMNLVNGACGYLPPAHLYDEEVYQVWQTPFERGSLEQLLESAAGTLRGLMSPGEGRGAR